MPEARAERAENSESEDGADEREARDDAADPTTSRVGAQIFGEKHHGAERDEVELDEEPAIFPVGGGLLGGGLGSTPDVEEDGEEGKKNDGPGKIDVSLAVDGELIGAVPLIERRVWPVAFEFRMMKGDPVNGVENDERKWRGG